MLKEVGFLSRKKLQNDCTNQGKWQQILVLSVGILANLQMWKYVK